MAWREENENPEPSKSNLLSASRRALISVLLGRRRLVAFTGSGLSLIYGGVTWQEGVNLILETTLDLIDRSRPYLRPTDLQRLADRKAMLESYYVAPGTTAEKLPAEDLLVAIELADEAREVMKSIRRRYQHQGADEPTIESANEIFARLSVDDTLAVRKRLIERIHGHNLARKAKREKAEELDKHFEGRKWSVQDLAARLYDLDWIIAKGVLPTAGQDLAKKLRTAIKTAMPEAAGAVLPIEKRSIMAPLLGLMPETDRVKLLESALGTDLENRSKAVPRRPLLDPLNVLKQHFEIERFLTLNYDWELERLLMIPDLIERYGRGYTVERAQREDEIRSEEPDQPDQPGLRLMRRMPDGRFTASDVYRPRASAHLYEFALNSPDHAAHIVHLHGRVDDPRNMVARDDDYNRVYRRDSSNPRSLERALDVALTGNPILFVGIGLSEAEITRAFRLLVANGRVSPENPAFALMPLDKAGDAGWRRQVSNYQRFGLHILPYGHPSRGPQYSLTTHKAAVELLEKRVKAFKDCLKSTPPRLEADTKLIPPDKLQLLDKSLGDAGTAAGRAILAGDNLMYDWLVKLMAKDYAGIVSFLGTGAADRLAEFAEGCLDYLERLNEKLISVALVHEIERLAADADYALLSISRQLPAREQLLSPAMGELATVTCLRHLDPAVPTPSPATPVLHRNGQPVGDAVPLDHGCALVFGDTGIGKGAYLRRLYQLKFQADTTSHLLVINFTFGLEIDSTIALVYLFLMKIYESDTPIPANGASNTDYQRNKFNKIQRVLQKNKRLGTKPAYIIFTGIDRLFDDKAQPISADFDQLLRLLLPTRAPYGHNFLVVASTAIQRWFIRGFAPTGQAPPWPVFTLAGPETAAAEDALTRPYAGIAALYRDNIAKLADTLDTPKPIQRQIGNAHRESATAVPTGNVRSTAATGFLRTLLDLWPRVVKADPATQGKEGDCVALDMAILNLLALVGAPLELDSFRFDPEIWEILERKDPAPARWPGLIQEATRRLVQQGLATRIPERFIFDRAAAPIRPDAPLNRIALHRVVLAELRTRLGVPLGDAPLSNTFSLSLAASLPVDVILPGIDVRQRLRTVLGHFRNAWRDVALPDDVQRWLNAIREDLKGDRSLLDADAVDAIEDLNNLTRTVALRSGPTGPCLRAAANIVRSFFSVTSLVALNPTALPVQSGRRTEFEVHKRRIRQLFSAVRELHNAEQLTTACLTRLAPTMRFDPGKEAVKALQAHAFPAESDYQPLYGGEMVWLHNERGVISLIQGDLYEAEFSFGQALKANQAYKGDGSGHYRRRIDLNRSLLVVERGKLREGRALLKQLRDSVETGAASEARLLKPLIEGYLGLIAHLNGRSEDAEGHYDAAIKGAVETEQRRASGLFQMRRAALRRSRGRHDAARDDIAEAIRSAEASCQLDVLWRARLIQAQIQSDGAHARELAEQALGYADAVGLHRVGVEALIVGANFAMVADDLESAAEMVAKAMVRVTRYGMILRRISLRVMMGEIMLRQGDPGGVWLLRRSIAHADRVGYQSGIQHAQMALVKRPTAATMARLAQSGSAAELGGGPTTRR